MEKEALIDMLSREAVRGVKTRVLAQALTEYTEHTKECESASANVPCSCGLATLIEEVDAL